MASPSQQIINKLTIGLGAVRLSPKVTSIQLSYPVKLVNEKNKFCGPPGTRYFLKEYLPRIKYNNPNLNISLNPNTENVSQIKVDFSDSAPKTIALSPKIQSHDICYQLLEQTLSKAKKRNKD